MGDKAQAAERLAEAHRALRADPAVQFTLPTVPPPAKPPAWLEALGRFLRPVGRAIRWLFSWLPDAPYARILLWSILAIAAALVIWTVVERVRHGEWRLPRRKRRTTPASSPEEEAGWTPDAAPVRAWLKEADALAAAGRFAEAAHLLLFRSVEDLARRRPRLVRPALTARELAAAEGVPASARPLFAGIAALVERSLFGGRAVDADDWSRARADYTAFALPQTWRG